MGWEANWLETECSASKAVLLLGSRLVSLPGSASSSEEDWPIQPWAGAGQHRDALCMAFSQSSAMPAATDPPPPWTTKLGSDFSALFKPHHPVYFPEQVQIPRERRKPPPVEGVHETPETTQPIPSL